MKRNALLFIVLLLVQPAFAQLKPYVQAFTTSTSIEVTAEAIEQALNTQGLDVVGSYEPDTKEARRVIIISSSELEQAVGKFGGLRGFALTQRIALTKEGSTVVSYTNPAYWGNAYFQDDFPAVSTYYKSFEQKLVAALQSVGNLNPKPFGSEDGEDVDDLREYQYMMGMPEFDDTEELESFNNHAAAKAQVDGALKKGVPNVKQVYRVELPGKELVLYGLALTGPEGEGKFMPIIDIGSPKHTAFLPYEVLITEDEVHMLHGRYRIALSFPDLTMGTFSQIMSTPGDIEDLLLQLVE
jgi:hypothetical protein